MNTQAILEEASDKKTNSYLEIWKNEVLNLPAFGRDQFENHVPVTK